MSKYPNPFDAYGQSYSANPFANANPFGQPSQPAHPGFGQPAQPPHPGFGQPAQPAQPPHPGFGQPAQPAQPPHPGFGQPAQPGQWQAQLQAHQSQQAQLYAQHQAQARAQYEAQLQAQRQAQLQAQHQAQLQAQYQAQIQAKQQAQLQAQHQGQAQAQYYHQYQPVDPRYQHTYAMPQLNPHASIQDRMRYQEQLAHQAREAQRRQYAILKKEQDKQITHLLYYDPQEPKCEDAFKIGKSLMCVHLIDVTQTPDDAIPECVTALPALVDVRGKGKCYRGSKCKRFLLRLTKPHAKGTQRYIDPSTPVGLRMTIDAQTIENQEEILDSELQSLSKIYERWPEFDKNPVKAKAQSDAWLRKLKQKIDRLGIKPDEPIADVGGASSHQVDAQVQKDLRRMEEDARVARGRGPRPATFQQYLA